VDVEEIARAAVESDLLGDSDWTSFEPGEARAVAMDVNDDVAAVFVLRRWRDGNWDVDVVRLLREGDEWIGIGSGGATMGDLPPIPVISDEGDLGPTFTGLSGLDGDVLLTAAGFVHGPVSEVELRWSGGTRRASLEPGERVFVIAVRADEDEDLDAIDLLALSAGGEVLMSSEARSAEASAPGLTVAEALQLPRGSAVSVHGVLLALRDQPALLCDQLDYNPPRPRGAAIRLDSDAPFPLTEFGDGWASPLTLVASGVIVDGVLTPGPND
jgi:hypothetical protein